MLLMSASENQVALGSSGRDDPERLAGEHRRHDREGLVELGDLALDRVELRLRVLAHAVVDLVHGLQERLMLDELVERVAVLASRKADGLAQPGVRHLDDRLLLPALRRGEHRERPLHRVEPQDALAAGERLRAAHAPRGLAREGVERLGAPALLDRDLTERVELRPR
jgi:hypothetical protein